MTRKIHGDAIVTVGQQRTVFQKYLLCVGRGITPPAELQPSLMAGSRNRTKMVGRRTTTLGAPAKGRNNIAGLAGSPLQKTATAQSVE